MKLFVQYQNKTNRQHHTKPDQKHNNDQGYFVIKM